MQDREDENEAGNQNETMIAIESSHDSDAAGGCGGTLTGMVRERLTWEAVQTFDHSIMSQEEIRREITSMLDRDLKLRGLIQLRRGLSA